MKHKSLDEVLLVISENRPLKSINKHWGQHQEKLQYDAWFKTIEAEYLTLYPVSRTMKLSEELAYDIENFSNDNPKPDNFTHPLLDIVYISKDGDGNEVRTPVDYLTFKEWQVREEVTQAEVLEVTDEDGVITTPYSPELTALVTFFTPDTDTYSLLTDFQPYKNKLVSDIVDKFDRELDSITTEYPQLERESWHVQVRESIAHLADNSAVTPLLTGMADELSVLGITVTDLANSIMSKSDSSSELVGRAIGKKKLAILSL